jgi:hypothetical protein
MALSKTEVSFLAVGVALVLTAVIVGVYFAVRKGKVAKQSRTKSTVVDGKSEKNLKTYKSKTPAFDVLFPLGPNDVDVFLLNLELNKKNVIGYRNMYVVTRQKLVIPDCIVLAESEFPFTINDIVKILDNQDRAGWYFQQLLKLYAGSVITGILPHYLVIDADTSFLRPTTFLDQTGRSLFAYGTEMHGPYFEHMQRLHPSFRKVHAGSGIVHHMLFNNLILDEMKALVEKHHGNHKPFWQIFIDTVTERHGSGASEYELYFHFAVNKYENTLVAVRALKWKNIRGLSDIEPGLDFVSCHYHSRD